MTTTTRFANWLDTFIDEKGIDTEHVFEIDTDDFWRHHTIPFGVVVEAAKNASATEQAQIKNIIVRIDFANGNMLHFFEHLAKGLAANA
jgi:hypothetical protein